MPTTRGGQGTGAKEEKTEIAASLMALKHGSSRSPSPEEGAPAAAGADESKPAAPKEETKGTETGLSEDARKEAETEDVKPAAAEEGKSEEEDPKIGATEAPPADDPPTAAEEAKDPEVPAPAAADDGGATADQQASKPPPAAPVE